MTNPLKESDPVWSKISAEIETEAEESLLRFLYQGLIFPKEDSLMLRCRMTGAELSSVQLRGLAQIAENFGGGYLDITTRANFQIRDIAAEDGLNVLRSLLQLEIVPATKGLNNLRNVTVTPTSGFDPHEVTDVIPLANAVINALLYQPALQGLPGKFNIAVDSGGMISVASEANDVGIRAVRENGEVRYRMSFANLKNQKTIAEDSGWSLKRSR